MFKRKLTQDDYNRLDNVAKNLHMVAVDKVDSLEKAIDSIGDVQHQILLDFYVENFFINDFSVTEGKYILKTEAKSFEVLTEQGLCSYGSEIPRIHTYYCTPQAYKYNEEQIKEWAEEVKEYRKDNK